MSVFDYFSDHWGMLVLILGMTIALTSEIHLEKRMVNQIAATNVMLLLYSVACYIETYLGNQENFSILRPVLSAVCYSLIAFILVNIVMIVYPKQKAYLLFPAILNAVLCFISIPTGIVFTIDENNHFQRGTLGYLTYFINALYLAYLLINVFKSGRKQKEDYRILFYMALTSLFCLVAPLFVETADMHWFNITIAVDIMLYYVYLLQQFTKRDPLTKLLNRQTYYSDADKYINDVTAVITMDMNGLKEINDSEGHVAGDTALKALADCFWTAAHKKGQRVYRIGGDEYVILCLGSGEDDVKSLIERIRAEVSETPYTCSIGYAMKSEGSTIDSLYHQADEMLYEEKKEFYARTGKTRQRKR